MQGSAASSDRGHTNLLTGAVHLLDMPYDILNRFILQGRLPRPFLSSFLHESTHFWCGASPLGMALAFLNMRAHRSVILGKIDRKQIFHDVIVSEAARLLLKPLMEGMALFAEFDSFPGNSEVVAPPNVWTGQLFMPLDETGPIDEDKAAEWFSDRMLSTIIGYRASDEAHTRKLEILMQSFVDDRHFYLPGYLSVKTLFGVQASRTPHFYDRDFFLHFLRDWICRDWVLVTYLLDEVLSPTLACTLISERLQRRLWVMMTEDLSSEAALFERDIVSGEYGTNTVSLRIKRHEAASGIHIYNKYAFALAGQYADKSALVMDDKGMVEADLLLVAHRQQMLLLAAEEVEIEVLESRKVFVRKAGSPKESFYINAMALPEAVQGTTPGWLAVYYLPDFKKVATVALRENQAVLWFLNGLEENRDAYDLRLSAVKAVTTEGTRAELSKICRRMANDYDPANNPLSTAWTQHVRQIYERIALAVSVPELRAALPQVLARKGMYDLFGKDGDLLMTFVAMSLFPIVNDEARSLLKASLGRDGIDFTSCLARLRTLQETCGFQFFVERSNGDILCAA